jgi:hypothetical protein
LKDIEMDDFVCPPDAIAPRDIKRVYQAIAAELMTFDEAALVLNNLLRERKNQKLRSPQREGQVAPQHVDEQFF